MTTSRWLKPKSMDHHEFALSAVSLMALFSWFNMSLAPPGPSEDLNACIFAEASLFRKHMTPGQLPVNSFSVGKKMSESNDVASFL